MPESNSGEVADFRIVTLFFKFVDYNNWYNNFVFLEAEHGLWIGK
jgi:hypothetical protein